MALTSDWTFLLCNAAGSTLAELTTASGKTVVYKRNSYAEARLTISHEDVAATLLWDALRTTGIPRLKAYRRSFGLAAVKVFDGWLAPFQESAEEAATMALVFRSPFWRLYGDGSASGRFLSAALSYTAIDAGQIAKGLIDATAYTGLATTGTIAATVARDRSYAIGANIGQSVANLTNINGGFDFIERYADSGMAVFDVVATAGTDKSATVRFQYGRDTMANVRQMDRIVTSPVNVAQVTGGVNLVSTQVHAASRTKYGDWPTLRSYPDIIEQATLDARATALLRPEPVRLIRFSPEPALAPRPLEAFDLGDTVSFLARRSALTESVSVRVNGFTIVVDEQGREVYEIEDPAAPDEDATMQASMSVEAIT